MSVLTDAILITTANAYKAGKLYSIKPFDGSGDFDVVRATTAWRRNSAGIWESVANNVPRLHYPVGGGCPSVLVEPQRTNEIRYSQQFTNAAWLKNASITVNDNVITSPDGTNNASEILNIQSSSANNYLDQQVRLGVSTSGLTFSASIWVKAYTSADIGKDFNLRLQRGVGATFVNKIASIVLNGDWQEIKNENLTMALDSTGVAIRFLKNDNTDINNIYIWQAQLEEGTTATSIIPTVATTVTRNEDVIDVTTPAGVTEIVETFSDGSTNTETTIPATYQIPQGEITSIVMT